MRKLYFFAFFLVLYELATYLANDMIMPGMVQVIREFKASNSNIALSLSLYILGNCTLILIAGSLAERYGKRLMILLGSFSFLVFTLLVACSHSIHEFMTWRFLEGCGLAVITIGYGLIHSNFNDKKSVKIIALMGNVSILAPLIGPMLGSIIVSHHSWRFVFYYTLALSVIAFLGLYRYTPQDQTATHPVNVGSLLKQYQTLLKNKAFVQGGLCIILATMPILLWISQAPNLILITLQQDYSHYVYYQLISVGGIALASILMQFIAGNYPIAGIIKIGGYLVFSGLLFSVLGHHNMWVVVSGQFLYTLGLGLANGCLYRLVLSSKEYSTNMASTLLGFSQSLSFVIGITLTNSVIHHFHYSIQSFTLVSLGFGLVTLYMIMKTAALYQHREWH